MEINDKDIDQTMKNIFLEVFRNLDEDNFSINKKQQEFEDWDSLAHIEIISKIESNFNISLELNEVVGLNSPKDFSNLVKIKLKGKKRK